MAPIAGLRRQLVLFTHSPDTDLVSQKIAQTRVWEPFETRLWLACQRPGDRVVDVGANLGYYSLLSALASAPAGAIYAFEPAVDNFTLLRRNLALNACENLVEPVQAALGTDDALGTLYRSASNMGDHQVYAGDGPRVEESIALRNGAAVLAGRVAHIDLLKLDTQGSEHAVLTGLLPLLQASGGKLRMLVELTPFSLRLGGSSGRELVTLIAGLGLPLFIVDHLAHELVPCDCEALCEWSDNVAAGENDRGFMNIFAGQPPHGL